MAVAIDDIPPEVLAEILAYAVLNGDGLAVVLVSHRFRALALAPLYSSISLSSKLALALFARTLDASPELGHHVRKLSIYPSKVHWPTTIAVAKRCPRVDRLAVRFPASDLPLALEFLSSLNPSSFEWVTQPCWHFEPGHLFIRFLSRWTRLRSLSLTNFCFNSTFASTILSLTPSHLARLSHIELAGSWNKNLDAQVLRSLLEDRWLGKSLRFGSKVDEEDEENGSDEERKWREGWNNDPLRTTLWKGAGGRSLGGGRRLEAALRRGAERQSGLWISDCPQRRRARLEEDLGQLVWRRASFLSPTLPGSPRSGAGDSIAPPTSTSSTLAPSHFLTSTSVLPHVFFTHPDSSNSEDQERPHTRPSSLSDATASTSACPHLKDPLIAHQDNEESYRGRLPAVGEVHPHGASTPKDKETGYAGDVWQKGEKDTTRSKAEEESKERVVVFVA